MAHALGVFSGKTDLEGDMSHRVVALVRGPLSPFELACASEVFGLQRPGISLPYVFSVCAETPGPVRTKAGYDMWVSDGLEVLESADTVIVAGWDPGAGPPSDSMLSSLLSAHAGGARIVGFCGATFVLAAAGLLDGRSATTHWRLMADLSAAFPRVRLERDALYVDHGDVATSAGTASAIDLSLALVRRDVGAHAADVIARHMVMPPRREAGQAQYAVRDNGPRRPQDSLGALTQWISDHLQEEITVETLAAQASMSSRSLARRFQDQLGTSPAKWVVQQRVDAARRLLETTDLPVEAIAQRTGLASAGNLRRRFRDVTGTTPSAYRNTFSRLPSVSDQIAG